MVHLCIEMRPCSHMQLSLFPSTSTKTTHLSSLYLLKVSFYQYAKQENLFLFSTHMHLMNASSSSSFPSSFFLLIFLHLPPPSSQVT